MISTRQLTHIAMLLLLLCPQTKVYAASAAPDTSQAREFEVVGLRLQGRHRWTQLDLLDMESLVTTDGRRYLPLRRLLRIMGVTQEQRGNSLQFTLEGVGQVVMRQPDLETRINGETLTLDAFASVSPLSGQPEVFVAQDNLPRVLPVAATWDDPNYRLILETRVLLPVWANVMTRDRRGYDAEWVTSPLPSVHGEASAQGRWLDYIEVRLRGQATSTEDLSGYALDGRLERSIGGHLAGGRYELDFGSPVVRFDGEAVQSQGDPTLLPQRATWLNQREHSEVQLGDAGLRLSDLAFPGISLTGVRSNGLAGSATDPALVRGSRRGLLQRFSRGREFRGQATVGSRVELLVNGRPLQDTVVVRSDDELGDVGTYTFEPVNLGGAGLYEVTIIITEPDGLETREDFSIQDTQALLPAGGRAWVAGLGTDRRRDNDGTLTWRTGGLFAGASLLHGWHDRLTVGVVAAGQQGMFRELQGGLAGGERGWPEQSGHSALLASWQPWDGMLIHGELGASADPDLGEHSGLALRLQALLQPDRTRTLEGQVFAYTPGFFDGRSPLLEDLYGARLRSRWQLQGAVRSIDTSLALVQSGDDQLVALGTAAVRLQPQARWLVDLRSTLLAPSFEPLRQLHTVSVRHSRASGLQLSIDLSVGDDILFAEDADLLRTLNAAGLVLRGNSRASARLQQRLGPNHAVALNLQLDGVTDEAALEHLYTLSGQQRLVSEVRAGWDLDASAALFSHRLRLVFGILRRNSLTLTTRYADTRWRIALGVDLQEVFAPRDDRLLPERLTNTGVDIRQGGIRGTVFLDYDGDGEPDIDEPGISGVDVYSSQFHQASSDGTGAFYLSVRPGAEQAPVLLDADTLPGFLTPTHARQMCQVTRGVLTEVHLGLAPFIALSGQVVNPDQQPVAGVRVHLLDADSQVRGDSLTAGDGSFYLGSVIPGHYRLALDPATVPRGLMPPEQQPLSIFPRAEFNELDLGTFELQREWSSPVGARILEQPVLARYRICRR